jgi:hypothetical protein
MSATLKLTHKAIGAGGRDRRLPVHRKEVLADLSGILHRSQAGTETRSRLSRRRRQAAQAPGIHELGDDSTTKPPPDAHDSGLQPEVCLK